MLAKIAQYAKKPMPYILLFNIVLWIPSLFTSPGPGIDISRSASVVILFVLSTALTYAAYSGCRKALKFARSKLKQITRK